MCTCASLCVWQPHSCFVSSLVLSPFLPELTPLCLSFLWRKKLNKKKKKQSQVERNLFYRCCLSWSQRLSRIEVCFLFLPFLSSSEFPRDSSVVPLPLHDPSVSFSHFLWFCFLSSTSCLSGIYMLINKLPLIVLVCWWSVMLRFAKRCWHRGLSAVLLCGFMYRGLGVYRGCSRQHLKCFQCMCEMLRWKACCTLVQWFSEFGCGAILIPSCLNSLAHSSLYRRPLWLSIVFGLVQISSLVAPLRSENTCAERMCCLACLQSSQLPHISPVLSVMFRRILFMLFVCYVTRELHCAGTHLRPVNTYL